MSIGEKRNDGYQYDLGLSPEGNIRRARVQGLIGLHLTEVRRMALLLGMSSPEFVATLEVSLREILAGLPHAQAAEGGVR